MAQDNPFALARASDFTDKQINSLWVEIGAPVVDAIIEPHALISKYILGGKGSGKTHLLRYYSYPATKMRYPDASGLSIVGQQGFLAVFLRATGLDAARFELSTVAATVWQQAFAIYLELRLVEMVLDSLCNIQDSSPSDIFTDQALLQEFSLFIVDETFTLCQTVREFRTWVISARRRIDDAVNNAAFTGKLEIHVPFALGSLCLSIGPALAKWNPAFSDIPLLYLLDEIENFSESQQQVVNSLIRYAEGRATFRVTGRLYAIQTLATLNNGEENRDGAEFKKTVLDQIITEFKSYPEFARRFVIKRLAAAGTLQAGSKKRASVDPARFFEEINSSEFYADYLDHLTFDIETSSNKKFATALKKLPAQPPLAETDIADVTRFLTEGLPLLIGKLNLLLFAKKLGKRPPKSFASALRSDALRFVADPSGTRGYYKTAYGHYSGDLFAQLCRESKIAMGVPYAGFDTFIKMSSGNPRNLLILLGRAFEIASFKDHDFVNGPPLNVADQTEAVHEASKFMYESDSNYGNRSDQARVAVARLATILRTARFALNIPEVAPLTISFSGAHLSESSTVTLQSALNYSLLFEIPDGRPDRNSQNVNRKIQLNPLLSPRWGLPVGRRGDLSMSAELINCVLDPSKSEEFDYHLRSLDNRWNSPFGPVERNPQPQLF